MNIGFEEVEIAVLAEVLNCTVQRALGNGEFSEVSGKRSTLILEISKLRYLRAVDWELQRGVFELSYPAVDSREFNFEICLFADHQLAPAIFFLLPVALP